jgi:hypothetical protein
LPSLSVILFSTALRAIPKPEQASQVNGIQGALPAAQHRERANRAHLTSRLPCTRVTDGLRDDAPRARGRDFTGLWDVALEFSGGDRNGSELAGEALTQLVSDGFVGFYIGGPLDSLIPDPVASDFVDVFLAPGPQWAVPEAGVHGPFVYIAATDAGRAHDSHQLGRRPVNTHIRCWLI